MNYKILHTLILALSFTSAFSQKSYWTSAGSIIFSTSNASYQNPVTAEKSSVKDAVRFTFWLNSNFYFNHDFNDKFGVYSGFGINNIGLITKETSSILITTEPDYNMDVKWKRRAYSLTVPLAFKIGKMEKGFHFFAGGQYDWLFHYKEKEFLTSGKRKMSEWFSKRVNSFLPSIFGGVTLKGGFSIQFTYALDDFMNKDFSYKNSLGTEIQPYKYMDSRILYISIFVKSPFNKINESETKIKQIALL